MDCAAGTGKLWQIGMVPSCTATALGGVFGLLYNPGNQNTYTNCWSSLDVYDLDVENLSKDERAIQYFAYASGPVLGCAFVCLLLRCQRQLRMRAQRRSSGGIGAGRATGPPSNTIGKPTIEEHFPVSHSTEGNQCVVCLVDIEEHEQCRRLQCGHEFHAECIADWWTHRPRAVLECPLCKRKQTLGAEDPDGLPPTDAHTDATHDGAEGQVQAVTATGPARAAAPTTSDAASTDLESGRGGPAEPNTIQAT